MDEYHIFLLFPRNVAFNDETEYLNYIGKLGNLIDRADCQKGAELYYNATNKDAFIDDLAISPEVGGFYNLDLSLVINALLRDADDWENNQQHQSNCLYKIWDADSQTLFDDNNITNRNPEDNSINNYDIVANQFISTYKEITDYLLQNKPNCLLLAIDNCVPILHRNNTPSNKFFVFKDCLEENQAPSFVIIPYLSTFSAIEAWFQEQQTPRLLNNTDPRHNESSPHYIPNKSPMLHDIWRDTDKRQYVQELLNSAITDQRSEENINKDLINYDAEKERYIWFERETDNQYHAYHLAIPRTHERDVNRLRGEGKIPERVKQILKQRDIVV